MKAIDAPTTPTPPSLMAALLAGFDTAANRVSLILFPLVLDLMLWLGPQVRLKELVERLLSQMQAFYAASNPQMLEVMEANQELWQLIGERLNLMAALRTYPVGIPSLMASRLPEARPELLPGFIFDVPSIPFAFALWALLSLLGLLVATFYFVVVARAAAPVKKNRRGLWSEWAWASLQVILLTLLWAVILGAISVPASCVVSALTFANPSIGRFALLMFGGGLLWLMFPLLLSPHGIFVHGLTAVASMKRSFRITRMTFPATGLFFLMVVVISQGLDILWSVPAESSWFTLIGVLGHAFITTGLLAASIIYYHEADQWTQKMMVRLGHLPAVGRKV